MSVVHFNDGAVEVKKVPLHDYKKLVRIEVKSYEEAVEKLTACQDKAEIIYRSNQPVNGLQLSALRAIPSFVKFSPRPERESVERAKRKLLSDDALFKNFYESRRAKQPDDEQVDWFLRALKGEEL